MSTLLLKGREHFLSTFDHLYALYKIIITLVGYTTFEIGLHESIVLKCLLVYRVVGVRECEQGTV